ncbi:MORN repeat family protein [Collimonas arenae]|uniref:MORN repeat family protein n=2 Tax=Collimonas arenae TaxID=279058 RepID=A0A127PKM5_9BURK|nr:MORN repeat family protein [Collimonas arenae]AMP08182.1 MORN repeat family protein [Collimonas arenae]
MAGAAVGFTLAAAAAPSPNVTNAANAINGANAAANVANTGGLPNAVTAAAAEAPRHWTADTSNGCKIWSPEPIANEISARWSGRCENGLAQGPGTVRWLSNNKQVAELTGTMEQGKVRGHTTGVEEPGNRFDGMFIDSLPEGEGKASYADGSTYAGEWHRGRQLGYGIMTFPPAHPQYQDMLNNGKGVRTDNGIYVMRGWWEGKTFVTACDSEEECEKAVVALMKQEQATTAAKAVATTPATSPAPAAAVPAPLAAPVKSIATPESSAATPAIPAVETGNAPASPPSATPAVEPAAMTAAPVSDVPATPATEAPAIEPAASPIVPAPSTTGSESAVVPAPEAPAAEATQAPAAAPASPVEAPAPMAEPAPAAAMPAAGPTVEPEVPKAPPPAAEDPANMPTPSAPADPAPEQPVLPAASALTGISHFKRT